MISWWESAPAARRLARGAALAAIASLTIALASWPFTLVLAVPGFIVGAAAVLFALFARFRAEHLEAVARK